MNDNRCVCCGAIIPEGRQVCPLCEKEVSRLKRKLFPRWNNADYWLNEWVIPIGFAVLLIWVLIKIGSM